MRFKNPPQPFARCVNLVSRICRLKGGSIKLTSYGAAGEVTGSCHLFEDQGLRFLVDCGLFQGGRFNEERNAADFPFAPNSLDAVFLTHAHLDHSGRLAKLVADGYRGPIYATAATRDLVEILAEDAAEIMEEDAQRGGPAPLYRPEDVPGMLRQFVTVDYHEVTKLPGGWQLTLWDAGHILGSSIIQLTHSEFSIVFSGDLGNSPVPILHATESPLAADVVVMESTYGNHHHEPADQRSQLLEEAIEATVAQGGVLMIPSFALERTQELLYYIDQLKTHGKIPDVPVFLDSPLAIHATRIFEQHPEVWSDQARQEFRKNDFFEFPNLHICATRQESRAINAVPAPKVIIAGSGMMQGGRMLHHAKRYLSDPHSMLLIIGYQAHGTLGRALLGGSKRVRIHDENIFVRAQIRAIGAFSAHADQPKLLDWLKHFHQPPKVVVLVHGEPDRMEGLSTVINRELRFKVVIPENGQSIDLSNLGR